MAESRTSKGICKNPTASDSSPTPRRIPPCESDALSERIKEVIGDKKLVWFASECDVGESTLRNILQGAMPRTDILVAIAEAGGVTVDWLATGRGPKTRVEWRQATAPGAAVAPNGQAQPPQADADLLDEAELLEAYRTASPAARNALAKVVFAIRDQTMSAWFRAGLAISDVANLFDKKR
jgi:hypothetical protein